MNITYLLEDTAQSGGVRVILAQADSLIARGHRVRLATKGKPLTWRSSQGEWVYLEDFSQLEPEHGEFVVGTFWTTLRHAHEKAAGRAIHLCQGYEGDISYYQPIKSQIDAAYSLPLPKMVVARSLVPVCKRFNDRVECIGQIVERDFFREETPSGHLPPRLLVSGESQIDLKGVPDAYDAVRIARAKGARFDLVRVSPWPLAESDPIEEIAESHVALPVGEMTRLLHSCDLLLAPNHREEGFGLPAAEAMASGIPVILTKIPSYLSFDDRDDFALFVDEGDSAGMAAAIVELLGNAPLRERLRQRGREVAAQFRAELVAERIERFLSFRASAL